MCGNGLDGLLYVGFLARSEHPPGIMTVRQGIVYPAVLKVGNYVSVFFEDWKHVEYLHDQLAAILRDRAESEDG